LHRQSTPWVGPKGRPDEGGEKQTKEKAWGGGGGGIGDLGTFICKKEGEKWKDVRHCCNKKTQLSKRKRRVFRKSVKPDQKEKKISWAGKVKKPKKEVSQCKPPRSRKGNGE